MFAPPSAAHGPFAQNDDDRITASPFLKKSNYNKTTNYITRTHRIFRLLIILIRLTNRRIICTVPEYLIVKNIEIITRRVDPIERMPIERFQNGQNARRIRSCDFQSIVLDQIRTLSDLTSYLENSSAICPRTIYSPHVYYARLFPFPPREPDVDTSP
jgi:hypothetical protein